MIDLRLGNALDIIKTLPDGSIDAVITDPPYGISHQSNHGASWERTQIQNDHDDFLRNWIIDWAEARNLPWAVFGNWKCQRPPQSRGVLIWDKGPASGMGDLSFPWKMSWEEIYIGGPGWKGIRDEGILRGHQVVTWESKGRRHPNEKPVSLISRLLAKLPEANVILDPFGGVGSTAVACQKAGKRCLIIEIDPVYHRIAERRILESATPLFAEASA